MEQSTSEILLEQTPDAIDSPRKSIDPSAEIAEPHLVLEENSFPHRSSISSLKTKQSSLQKSTVINHERKIQSSSPYEQQIRRRMTLEKKKSLSQSMFHHTLDHDQKQEESTDTKHLPDIVVVHPEPINLSTQDLMHLVSERDFSVILFISVFI